MAKLSDAEMVSQHIHTLDKAIKETVTAIRKSILNTDTEISERIKWNNPSFYYTGDIKPFEPKDYKREIAVFNLFKEIGRAHV